ncbi:ABC transporter substrate-binding protein [Candidatus Poriferisocius sp.]|uniref:ABC transporter substrate-binding protein n=1 Tax=Candidatus Poriferisocius sp. TaxID=3101276 RepID=UPI003B01FAF2
MGKVMKLLALLFAVALVAAACGNDDDDGTGAGEPAPTSTPASTEAPDSDGGMGDGDDDHGDGDDDDHGDGDDDDHGDDDHGDGDDDDHGDEVAGSDGMGECASATEGDVRGVDKENGVITIGSSQPFTGRAAVAGEGLIAGIIMAVAEVNANGGIDGCTFELVWEDDRFEIEQMVTNVRKMIEQDKVWAFVGTAGSQAIPSTYPDIEAAGTPLWGPVSPADQDIQEVYLTNPTRTEQGRICIDYFAEQGAKKVAAIGQDNELGEEAFNAIDMQAPVHGMEIVAKEEVEVLSDAVAPAVLSVIDSGADAVLTALDGTQNGLVLDQFHEAGFDPLVCSDAGSSGSGGQTTVGLAVPEAADGYLGALQVALPDSEDEFVQHWAELWEAYDGPGSESLAPNFSLQTYSIAIAFFELFDRLNGDYSYENFHATAEALVDDPIMVPSIPIVACGPLPGGHSCASGAGISEYDAETESWVQIRDFLAPVS